MLYVFVHNMDIWKKALGENNIEAPALLVLTLAVQGIYFHFLFFSFPLCSTETITVATIYLCYLSLLIFHTKTYILTFIKHL